MASLYSSSVRKRYPLPDLSIDISTDISSNYPTTLWLPCLGLLLFLFSLFGAKGLFTEVSRRGGVSTKLH